MARSRHDFERFGSTTPRIALALVAGALVACGASSEDGAATNAGAERAANNASAERPKPASADDEGSKESTKRFVARLIEQSATPIVSDPQSCLTAKAGAAATIGGELAAILGWYIDSDSSFAIEAGCEAGESATRQFCTLSFFHKAVDEEASAGFTFLGNPADGQLDPATLECFQTP